MTHADDVERACIGVKVAIGGIYVILHPLRMPSVDPIDIATRRDHHTVEQP